MNGSLSAANSKNMPLNRFNRDPKLSSKLTADYAALQNDLLQAKLLAADYQHQLCDKSNDFAVLKLALEKTTGDLEKLQAHIVALREERHKLANEVMRGVSLEVKLAAATKELKRLRAESRRDFIDVGFEEAKTFVVIPTEIEPHPIRCRRPA